MKPELSVRRKAGLRARIVGTLLAVSVLLPACAQIPVSSEVHSEQIAVQDDGPIFYEANGPKLGAQPSDIVQGFVSAQVAGFSDSWAVAREFLTPSAANKWAPEADTTVYAGDLALDLAVEKSPDPSEKEIDLSKATRAFVKASALSLGTVDNHGAYTESLASAQYEATFELERNTEGEWRISGLRDGLVMSHSMFERTFRSVSLYFIDPSDQFLVPDVRWYPRVRAETWAVQGLIAGPSTWLRDSVRSAIPEGTRLISMAVENGIAAVTVSNEILAANANGRSDFVTQMSATLTRIPGVRGVELRADQLELNVELDENLARDPARVSGDGSPVVLHKDRIHSVRGRNLEVVKEVGTLGGYDVTALAIPENVTQGVFRNGLDEIRAFPAPPAESRGPEVTGESDESNGSTGSKTGSRQPGGAKSGSAQADKDKPRKEESGTQEIRDAEPLRTATLIRGNSLVSPSIDRLSWVWTGERWQPDDSGELRLNSTIGSMEKVVAVPWLASRELLAVRISPDGTRIAVVSAGNGSSHVEVAGIVRDSSGIPLSVGDPVTVGGQITGATDVNWLDESTVWIVGHTPTNDAQTLFSARISGPSMSIAPAEDVQTLTAGRGTRGVILGTTDGIIRTRGSSGASWTDAAVDSWFPALPG